MAGPAIRVEGLGKLYRLAHGQERAAYHTLRESVMNFVANPFKKRGSVEEFWALSDVSFEVQPGEVVGIIGRNGAGKSTLLKILSRITKPTTGRVEINGRVGSLLEVGTGFHPELTGRENVYLNGSILGMSRAEIAKKFDEIVAFAEVEKFLDTPVKRYSSGMYVRLAFAVAAHLEPEILIVDEVLAVGDAEFQRKCLGKMGDVARAGRTVLLVSHNMASISNLCNCAVLLKGGRAIRSGKTNEVVSAYFQDTRALATSRVELARQTRAGWAKPLIQWVELMSNGSPTSHLPLGQALEVRVGYDTGGTESLRSPVLGVIIHHAIRGVVGGVNTRMTGYVAPPGEYQSGVLSCYLPELNLLQGEYNLELWLGDGSKDLDQVESAATFVIEPADIYGTGVTPISQLGVVFLRATWGHAPARGLSSCAG
jgi:lipopolysaccharide transport system ATP-binding protein